MRISPQALSALVALVADGHVKGSVAAQVISKILSSDDAAPLDEALVKSGAPEGLVKDYFSRRYFDLAGCPQCKLTLRVPFGEDIDRAKCPSCERAVTMLTFPVPNMTAADAVAVYTAGRQARRLGHFKLEKRLGKGGYGTVYLAYNEHAGRMVALKIFDGSGVLSADHFRKGFLRETRAGFRLNHPNIIRVYDYGWAGGLPYIEMEYVDGESLARMVEKNGALPPAEAARIIATAAAALHYAHCKGVIHRDIKPENILISRSGEVKISDFGLAKLSDPDISSTSKPTLVGTPLYMSPEQCRFGKPDCRSDVYSLGLVLYFALSGRPPFPDGTLVSLVQAQISQPVPPLPSSVGDAIEEFEEIITRATTKKPERRYQTAQKMADALFNLAKRLASAGGKGQR